MFAFALGQKGLDPSIEKRGEPSYEGLTPGVWFLPCFVDGNDPVYRMEMVAIWRPANEIRKSSPARSSNPMQFFDWNGRPDTQVDRTDRPSRPPRCRAWVLCVKGNAAVLRKRKSRETYMNSRVPMGFELPSLSRKGSGQRTPRKGRSEERDIRECKRTSEYRHPSKVLRLNDRHQRRLGPEANKFLSEGGAANEVGNQWTVDVDKRRHSTNVERERERLRYPRAWNFHGRCETEGVDVGLSWFGLQMHGVSLEV
ncbi:hypothetical protein DFP72DRAFT_1107980 [Ephemerocybe angulata]|uniref:Uncharacterized protein n=1 Tax=Ephemerocybe angulata TaxID=980116 RepID=A0A8H6ME84_9AGAR|nr:hypothetical protein DFP72DRAFT_1107980 [Tulosesus angulatus]